MQTFRQALYSKLSSITEVTAIVGSAIYPGAIPITHDLDRDGPALTWTIVTNPRGHVLVGSDGTSTARVQLSAWATGSTAVALTDQITNALFNALDGIAESFNWGDGTVEILSCRQEDEVELPEPPKAGRDEWLRQIASDYIIKYRVPIPTLS